MYIKQRIGIIGEEIASNYLKSINYETTRFQFKKC